ncbi:MAG: hypothetical protein QNL99_04410, partial [SAR86 cluster bacterium]
MRLERRELWAVTQSLEPQSFIWGSQGAKGRPDPARVPRFVCQKAIAPLICQVLLIASNLREDIFQSIT